MNFTLTRTAFNLYGILGTLISEDNSIKFVTLEHAYPEGSGFVPKLAVGTYTCIKGTHRLEHGGPITAFEVMDVPPFQGNSVSGILCGHIGNYSRDSNGCVLLGLELGTGCILESEKAFNAFMELQANCDSYLLRVV